MGAAEVADRVVRDLAELDGGFLLGVREHDWVAEGKLYRVVRRREDAYETEEGIVIPFEALKAKVVKWAIPEVDPGTVWDLVFGPHPLRPVFRDGPDHPLYYIEPPNPWRTAFTWDPVRTTKARLLSPVRKIRTLHRFGAPAFFKPSLVEVYAQYPKDPAGWDEEVVAFMTEIPEEITGMDARMVRAGFHEAVTTFFRVEGGKQP